MRERGFSLTELLVAIAVMVVLAGVAAPAVWGAYKTSSLAISASNIRQLAAGGAAYLGDNNYRFWPYRRNGEVDGSKGAVWWFGFESGKSLGRPEGQRTIDMNNGPLGPYVPRNMAPDPSFGFAGKPFKPKYHHGYIGLGYNVALSGTNGWVPSGGPPLRYWDLPNPSRTVVFATAAQINAFQKPASAKKPMIEEFYGFDDDRGKIPSVHFRHNGHAMVSYADGSVGLIAMDPSLQDNRAPEANVGRLASEYLR
jgi:prepilin-type N-terminal cleavage/methylation domain-containing protein/prepilin-type processing-associated H-X9-DG protein